MATPHKDYPRLMYCITGEQKRVNNVIEEKALGSEWARKPFPAPVPEAEIDPMAELQAKVKALTARIAALESRKK